MMTIIRIALVPGLALALLSTLGTHEPAAQNLLPCEEAVPSSSPKAPAAPKNLKIIKGADVEVEDDEDFTSGPSAREGGVAELTSAVTANGPHDYYAALASRPDCAGAYSLRSQAQVLLYRRQPALGYAGAVNYWPDGPGDTDPRRQDAAKFVIPEGEISLPNDMRIPLGDHHPQNLLITHDFWLGAEFAHSNTGISQFKGFIQYNSSGTTAYSVFMPIFDLAERHVHNLPAGGPFVAMMQAKALNSSFNAAAGTTKGGVNARLPYGASEQRNYGSEALGPWDTSVHPEGAEFGVAAERWTRVWSFFERDKANDWDGKFAYRWTAWFADTKREPVRMFTELVVSPNPTVPGGWTAMRLDLNTGGSAASLERAIPGSGRGPLTAYLRNLVVLRGTSKADVLKLLQKPLN